MFRETRETRALCFSHLNCLHNMLPALSFVFLLKKKENWFQSLDCFPFSSFRPHKPEPHHRAASQTHHRLSDDSTWFHDLLESFTSASHFYLIISKWKGKQSFEFILFHSSRISFKNLHRALNAKQRGDFSSRFFVLPSIRIVKRIETGPALWSTTSWAKQSV